MRYKLLEFIGVVSILFGTIAFCHENHGQGEWPVQSLNNVSQNTVTSNYGPRIAGGTIHDHLDIQAFAGSNVVSVSGGTIRILDNTDPKGEVTVIIRNESNCYRYFHTYNPFAGIIPTTNNPLPFVNMGSLLLQVAPSSISGTSYPHLGFSSLTLSSASTITACDGAGIFNNESYNPLLFLSEKDPQNQFPVIGPVLFKNHNNPVPIQKITVKDGKRRIVVSGKIDIVATISDFMGGIIGNRIAFPYRVSYNIINESSGTAMCLNALKLVEFHHLKNACDQNYNDFTSVIFNTTEHNSFFGSVIGSEPETDYNFYFFNVSNVHPNGCFPDPNKSIPDQYWNTRASKSETTCNGVGQDTSTESDAKFPDGNYTVRIFASDLAGHLILKNIPVVVDNFGPFESTVTPVAPAQPSNLKVDKIGDKTVNLTWSPNTEVDLYGYGILRDGFPLTINGSPAITPVNWFQDTSAQNNVTHNYQVIAFNLVQALGESSPSSPVTGTAQDTTPPTAPRWLPGYPTTTTDPQQCEQGKGCITLAWHSNAENDMQGYKVYRSTVDQVATAQCIAGCAVLIPVSQTIYPDKVSYGTYFYWLKAVDNAKAEDNVTPANNESNLSPSVSATVLPPQPSPTTKVKDNTDSPVQGAVVDFEQNGQVKATCTTSEGGTCTAGNFTPGTYDVAASKQQYFAIRYKDLTLSSSGEVLFRLSPDGILGDINGDDEIILSGTPATVCPPEDNDDWKFFSCAFCDPTQPPSVCAQQYNPKADLNGDGEVGLKDFGIISNFFKLKPSLVGTQDNTPPSKILTVNDGIGADFDITFSSTTLSAQWGKSYDARSGIKDYWYCIGTTPQGCEIVNWTSHSSTSVTRSGLSLLEGQKYYFSVKAENGVGLFSPVSTSDRITVILSHIFPAGAAYMFSVPFEPIPNPDAATVLGITQQQISANQFNLARWNPEDTPPRYRYYNANPSDPFLHLHNGISYWMKLANPQTVTIAGNEAMYESSKYYKEIDGNYYYHIPVGPSTPCSDPLCVWYQVGNPFPFEVAFKNLKVKYQGQIYPMTNPIPSMRRYAYTFKDKSVGYQLVIPEGILQVFGLHTLEPWQGYFFHVINASELLIPPIPSITLQPKPAPSIPTNANWDIRLAAQVDTPDGLFADTSVLGVATQATDSTDEHKIGDAPRNRVTGYFKPVFGGIYSADIRAPFQPGSTKTWDFEVVVDGNLLGQQVTLAWALNIPPGLTTMLKNLTNNETIDLKQASSYSYTHSFNPSKFQIIVASTSGIIGRVFLAGRTDQSGTVVRAVQGQTFISYTTTNTSGDFILPLPANQTYTLQFIPPVSGWTPIELGNQFVPENTFVNPVFAIVNDGTRQVSEFFLGPQGLGADLNKDGKVHWEDFNILQANFPVDSACNINKNCTADQGDVTGDSLVSLKDFGVFLKNFGLQLIPSEILVSKTVALSPDPSVVSAKKGEIFTVNVRFNSARIQAAEVHLTFDPSVLQVVNQNGQPTTELIPNTIFPDDYYNTVDNQKGIIDYAASRFEVLEVLGSANLVPITFKVISNGETKIAFSEVQPPIVLFDGKVEKVLNNQPGVINQEPANLYFTPATKSVGAGDIFTIDATAQGKNFNNVFATITYDPTHLQIVDKDGNRADLLEPGDITCLGNFSSFQQVVTESFVTPQGTFETRQTGKINLLCGDLFGRSTYQGPAKLSTMRFKVLRDGFSNIKMVDGSVWAGGVGFDVSPLPVATVGNIHDVTPPVISNIVLSKTTFSPLIEESITIDHTLSESAYVTIEVFGSDGNRYRFLRRNQLVGPGTYRVFFDGRGVDGGLLPDGIYTVKISARDLAQLEAIPQTKDVTIDNTPPVISDVHLSTNSFNPALGENVTLFYTLSEPAQVTVFVINASGQVVRKFTQDVSSASAPQETVWDAKDNDGNLVPDGVYTFKIIAQDFAGWSATDQTASVTVSTLQVTDVLVQGITRRGALITWKTNIPSDSKVEYGTSQALGQTQTDSEITTSHSVLITGLEPDTLYSFRVTSQSGDSVGQSQILTFRTLRLPTGTIKINNGAFYTNNRTVALTLSATAPDGFTVTEMQISSDGQTFTEFEPFAETKSWDLTEGEGAKTVYARFKDSGGEISDPSIFAHITLDVTPPEKPVVEVASERFPDVDLQLHGQDNFSLDHFVVLRSTQPITEENKQDADVLNDNVRQSSFTDRTGAPGTTYYYAALAVDGAGNESVLSDSVSVRVATINGGVVINEGAIATPNNQVVLTLTAEAAQSFSVQGMAISNDGIIYTPFEPFAPTKEWTLEGEDGKKTVYVKFKDNEGVESAVVKDDIFFDTTPPPAGTLTSDVVENAVVLNWLPVQDLSGIDHYTVYRLTEEIAPHNLAQAEVLGTVSSLNFTDTNAVAGVPYFYAITATDHAGLTGNLSNNAVGIIPPSPLSVVFTALIDDLTAEGDATVNVSGFDLAGNLGTGTETFVVDKTPPSRITDLTAQPDADSPNTLLTWSPSVDNFGVNRYAIYRFTESITEDNKAQAQVLGSVPFGEEQFFDTTGVVGQTYFYAVTSFDKAGNESLVSNSPSNTVTQEPTHEATLHVIVTGNGQPLQNATVVARGPENTVETQATNAQGVVTFLLPEGETQITAGLFGFITLVQTVTLSKDEVKTLEVSLEALGSTLSGTVTTDGFSALSGATITVFSFQQGVVGGTTTDGQGHYSVTVGPGEWVVQARKDGHVAVPEKVVNIPDNNTDIENADFIMPLKASHITGNVTNSLGEPVAGQTVNAFGPEVLTATTNTQGQYDVLVGPGVWVVSTSLYGHRTEPEHHDVNVQTNDETIRDKNFVLVPLPISDVLIQGPDDSDPETVTPPDLITVVARGTAGQTHVLANLIDKGTQVALHTTPFALTEDPQQPGRYTETFALPATKVSEIQGEVSWNTFADRLLSRNSLKVVDVQAPQPVTDLSATPTRNAVSLTWTRSTDNVSVATYKLFKKQEDTILFTEDFSAPTLDESRWSVQQDPAMNIRIENGVLKISGTPTSVGGPPAGFLVSKQSFSTEAGVSFEMEHSFLGTENMAFGMVGSAQFPTGEGAVFFVGRSSVVALMFTDQGPSFVGSPRPIVPGSTHHYKVVWDHGAARWLMDHELMAEQSGLSMTDKNVVLAVGINEPGGTIESATFDNVRVSLGGTEFSLLTTLSGLEDTFEDTQVLAGKTYSYQIQPVDVFGNEGPLSNMATATVPPPDTEPPSRILDLVAQAMDSPRIKLTWSAATDNEGVQKYHIFRGEGSFAEEVLFFEDFASNTLDPNRWVILSQAEGMNIVVQNERLEMSGTVTASPEGPPPAFVISSQPLPMDKPLAIEMDHSFIGNEFSFGLLGGLGGFETGPPQGGVFLVGSNFVAAMAFTGGEPQPVPVKQIEPGTLHRYRITKAGNTLTWFVDGEQVYTQEVSIGAPQIALGVGGTGEGEIFVQLASFDNIKVTTSMPPQLVKIAEVLHPTTTYIDATGIPGRTYTYAVTAVDTSSNEGPQSNLASATVVEAVVDTVPPSIFNPVPADGSAIGDVTPVISVQITDDKTGVDASTIQFVLDGRQLRPDEFTFDVLTGTLSHAVLFTQALSAGIHTVFINVKDLAGNPAPQFSFSFIVDGTPPEITITVPAASMDGTPGVFMWEVTDTAGLGAINVLLDGVSYSTDSEGSTPVPNSLGEHCLEVTAYDAVGNYATDAKCVTVMDDDITAPVLSDLSVSPALVKDGDSVEVSAKAADPESGVAEVFVDATSIGGSAKEILTLTNGIYKKVLTVNTNGFNGFKEIKVQATNADNDRSGDAETSDPVSLTIKIDNTAPTTTLTPSVPLFNSEFAPTSTTYTLTAVDPVVGGVSSVVAKTEFKIDSGAFQVYQTNISLTEGVHTISYRSTDNVGNIEQTQTFTVKVDATAPITILTPSVPLFNSEFAPLSTTYSLSANDPVSNGVSSGVSKTEFRIDTGNWQLATGSFTLSEGVHTIEYRSTDNVGNVESLRTVTVKVDATAPITDATVQGVEFIANGKTYISTSTSILLTATDPMSNGVSSGVSRTEFRVDGGAYQTGTTLTLPEGVHTVTFRSIDNVGNTEAEKSRTYHVDGTAPTTTASVGDPQCTLNGKLTVGGNTPITLSATDPEVANVSSGVKRTEYRLNGGSFATYSSPFTISGVPDGQVTIEYRSVDNVGNTETLKTLIVVLDTTPPTAQILSPFDLTVVNGSVAITGTCSGFDTGSWTLEFGQGSSFTVIKTSTDTITESTLATWDTTSLQSGSYILRLTAADCIGNQAQTQITLIVGSPAFSAALSDNFNKPEGVALDAQGNIYVADRDNNKVIKYSSTFQKLSELTGFNKPADVFVDAQNNVYVVDRNNDKVLRYDSTLNLSLTLTGFNKPEAVFADAQGNIYVADRNNNAVKIFNSTGTLLETLTGFDHPEGVAYRKTETKERLYVSDTGINEVKVFKRENNAWVLEKTLTGFNNPGGLYVTNKGYLYIVSQNDEKIYKYDSYLNLLMAFGTQGNNEGQFNKPKDIAVKECADASCAEELYIADRNHDKVQKFIYSGVGGKLKTLEKHLTPPLALGDVFTYPNPFSPNGDGNLDTTQIHYVLSQPADVTIRIYNVVGKLVKTFDTRFSGSAGGIAGENEVTWDGKNDLGRIVANGVYIVHIEAKAGDERVEVMKKFSVLK